jgi:hypothetical protein
MTTTFASILSSLILSGDISGAEAYMRGWCEGRAWTATEAASVRSACSKWGVDPARFGVAPRPACPVDMLPLRAHLICDPVPEYPTDEDFQRAAMRATNEWPEAAYVWRMEAIRWRRGAGNGKPLNLPVIQAATEKALVRLAAKLA